MNNIIKKALTIVLLFSITLLTAQSETEKKYKTKQLNNIVLTQYYRWFQTFERPQNETRISNHMTLFTNDVSLTTWGGPLKGKKGMRNFLDYVKDWKNTHHVKTTSIKQLNDSIVALEADIVYQNILPDGSKNNYKLHYNTELSLDTNQLKLPVFKKLELLPTETLQDLEFEDAYFTNRGKSFIHYWMHLTDNSKEKKEAFKELLANDCTLNLLGKSATNHEELINIIENGLKDFAWSYHEPKNILVTKDQDNINVTLNVVMTGILNSGTKIEGEVHQKWVLKNNLDNRFAKVKSLNVELVKPFQVVVNR